MDNNYFIKNIEKFCEVKNITVAKMLTELNLPKNTISNWKIRGTIPSAEVLFKLAQFFNVPMEYLLNGYDSTIEDDISIVLIKLRELSKEEREPIIELVLNQVEFYKKKHTS